MDFDKKKFQHSSYYVWNESNVSIKCFFQDIYVHMNENLSKFVLWNHMIQTFPL
jgi:hypothetical protein